MKKMNWNRMAWVSSVVLVVVLMAVARSTQNSFPIEEPIVSIRVTDENAFITEDELLTRVKRAGLFEIGTEISALDITSIEAFISKMPEIEHVDVFKKLGGSWSIEVDVRKPIARIFNQFGESYYLDVTGASMPPTANFQARVVVCSGFIPDRCDSLTVNEIINNVSLKTKLKRDEIYRISNYVCNDPFLQAQISQIHLSKGGYFILIPQVGAHKIIFGSANNDLEVKQKMEKLKVFYHEGLPFEGWNKYETIDLQFRNQIVCKKKEDYVRH